MHIQLLLITFFLQFFPDLLSYYYGDNDSLCITFNYYEFSGGYSCRRQDDAVSRLGQKVIAGVSPDDQKSAVREVGEEQNGVHQRIPNGDERVDRPQGKPVDDLLKQR